MHFEENETGNRNLAEDEKFTIKAINHEFDKMNSELWKRNKSGNNMINMNNLDNLDNKRISIIPGQTKLINEQYDVPVQEVYKQKLEDLKFARK